MANTSQNPKEKKSQSIKIDYYSKNKKAEKVLACIPFESALSRCRTISGRNKKFNALSNQDQHKEIAYEAIKLYLYDIYMPTGGTYWSDNIKWSVKEKVDNETDSKKLQAGVLSVVKMRNERDIGRCEVCARGGLALSEILIGNNVSAAHVFSDALDYVADGRGHNSVISMDTLSHAESAFEWGSGCDTMYKEFEDDAIRFVMIMCNIIVNGRFDEHETVNHALNWGVIAALNEQEYIWLPHY